MVTFLLKISIYENVIRVGRYTRGKSDLILSFSKDYVSYYLSICTCPVHPVSRLTLFLAIFYHMDPMKSDLASLAC